MSININSLYASAAVIGEQVFFNHLILERIANSCSVDDLKAVRLVNKSLSDASLSTWRNEASISLGSDSGWFNWGGRISMQEYLGQLENTESLSKKPFQNFKLEVCPLPPADSMEQFGWSESSADFRFWKECGATIKHLHLSYCHFDQAKLANVISKWVPNLESLVIDDIQTGPVANEEESKLWKPHENLKVLHVSGKLPFSTWRFLKNFPNLKEIKLGRFANNNLIPELRALRSESNPQESILNLCFLDVADTQQSLQGLAEARLPLQHLTLRLERDTPEDQVRDIMNSQSKTLESLTLLRFPLPRWSPFSATVLQFNFAAMKELYLSGSVVSSFDFLKGMPSLKKLVVNLQCFDKVQDIYDYSPLGPDQLVVPYFGDMVQNSKILLKAEDFVNSSLEHFEMDYASKMESMMVLGKWMPNLKFFAGILNNQTFSLVCDQWKMLEHFKLLMGSVICDEGITGITLASKLGKESRQPNLTDLNDLRIFNLESYCDSSRVTDASAHSAFLKMSKLESLQVCASPGLTVEAEGLLQNAIPNIKIIRNYGMHEPHPEVQCCQRLAFDDKNSLL